MTARNCCAATVDNDLLSLSDLPCLMPMVRCSRDAHRIPKHDETSFSLSLRGTSRVIFDFRIDAFSRFRKIVDPQCQQIGAREVSLEGGTT